MCLSERKIRKEDIKMEFKKFSAETVAELLEFLADHESFESINKIKNITPDDVHELMQELASGLRKPEFDKTIIQREAARKPEFSFNTSQVLDKLSAQEEDALFKSFKIDS